MAIKFEKIKPGMELFDIHREGAGNTMMSRLGCWRVSIISVDTEARTAMVSWNGNAPRLWGERQLRKLFTKKPKSYLKRAGKLL